MECAFYLTNPDLMTFRHRDIVFYCYHASRLWEILNAFCVPKEKKTKQTLFVFLCILFDTLNDKEQIQFLPLWIADCVLAFVKLCSFMPNIYLFFMYCLFYLLYITF